MNELKTFLQTIVSIEEADGSSKLAGEIMTRVLPLVDKDTVGSVAVEFEEVLNEYIHALLIKLEGLLRDDPQ